MFGDVKKEVNLRWIVEKLTIAFSLISSRKKFSRGSHNFRIRLITGN